MNNTIDYYNTNAKKYFDNTINADMSLHYSAFLEQVKNNGKILDAGCGSGRDSKYFLSLGYDVSAFDGSKEMAILASDYLGIDVRNIVFEEMDYNDEFDGIWCCASLLHVKKELFEKVAGNLNKALKNGGALYVSMKYGQVERVDDNKRYFNDITEDDTKIFTDNGFELIKQYLTSDVRPGREDKWINLILKKVNDHEK